MSLQTLVIQSNTGVSLYERQLTDSDTNPLLLSGLSTALSYMFDTVSEVEKRGFEHFNNRELYFVRHNLPKSTMVVVSTTELPKAILKQVERAHKRIERQFPTYFEGGRAGYDPLPVDDVDAIFRRFDFKVSLLGTLQLDIDTIKKTIALEQGQTLLKYYLTTLLEFREETEMESFSVSDLVEYLQNKALTTNVVANIVIKSWKADVFISTFPSADTQ